MSIKKKFLYINRKAPHGTIYALESLEVVLIGTAFEQDVSLAFIDDGVYQLLDGQDTSSIGTKNFSPTFRALGDYGVKNIYIEKESLEARGLNRTDLMQLVWENEETGSNREDSIQILASETLADIIDQQDVILSF
ncbi:MAG: sulfurtransferase complex subunit TusC [Pseudomonadota bacterium]